MRESINVSGATLLHALHNLKEQGISGVAILAESHISVHTQKKFSAFIYLCVVILNLNYEKSDTNLKS